MVIYLFLSIVSASGHKSHNTSSFVIITAGNKLVYIWILPWSMGGLKAKELFFSLLFSLSINPLWRLWSTSHHICIIPPRGMFEQPYRSKLRLYKVFYLFCPQLGISWWVINPDSCVCHKTLCANKNYTVSGSDSQVLVWSEMV